SNGPITIGVSSDKPYQWTGIFDPPVRRIISVFLIDVQHAIDHVNSGERIPKIPALVLEHVGNTWTASFDPDSDFVSPETVYLLVAVGRTLDHEVSVASKLISFVRPMQKSEGLGGLSDLILTISSATCSAAGGSVASPTTKVSAVTIFPLNGNPQIQAAI